ncbi:penicillin-binding transpeptidase domain-containing protein [Rubrivirga sp. IMCC45206]|uniref:penicillin-binding transpeptidase domain-containing protein n=1 Tax=Rubrivirga sp. IMCC45206 TaxID=3391614 RepID=UPI00398FF6F5
MKLPAALLALAAAACGGPSGPSPSPAAPAPARADSVADWSQSFADEGAVGTFVLLDPATGQTIRHDPARAATRFSPASTSKIWNALVFLDRGVVVDVDAVHAWDGVERRVRSWNHDHSLRTGVEASALWLFQRLAGRVGRTGYESVLAREPYGNATMGDPLEHAWLDGSLRVSADEQVAFFDRLRRGDLAFSAEHQATVRELLPTLAESGGAQLRGKTGWGLPPDEPAIGWLVGWVERPEGEVVYAMNAHAAPGETFDIGPGRLRIVRAVLADADAWPVGTNGAP